MLTALHPNLRFQSETTGLPPNLPGYDSPTPSQAAMSQKNAASVSEGASTSLFVPTPRAPLPAWCQHEYPECALFDKEAKLKRIDEEIQELLRYMALNEHKKPREDFQKRVDRKGYLITYRDALRKNIEELQAEIRLQNEARALVAEIAAANALHGQPPAPMDPPVEDQQSQTAPSTNLVSGQRATEGGESPTQSGVSEDFLMMRAAGEGHPSERQPGFENAASFLISSSEATVTQERPKKPLSPTAPEFKPIDKEEPAPACVLKFPGTSNQTLQSVQCSHFGPPEIDRAQIDANVELFFCDVFDRVPNDDYLSQFKEWPMIEVIRAELRRIQRYGMPHSSNVEACLAGRFRNTWLRDPTDEERRSFGRWRVFLYVQYLTGKAVHEYKHSQMAPTSYFETGHGLGSGLGSTAVERLEQQYQELSKSFAQPCQVAEGEDADIRAVVDQKGADNHKGESVGTRQEECTNTHQTGGTDSRAAQSADIHQAEVPKAYQPETANTGRAILHRLGAEALLREQMKAHGDPESGKAMKKSKFRSKSADAAASPVPIISAEMADDSDNGPHHAAKGKNLANHWEAFKLRLPLRHRSPAPSPPKGENARASTPAPNPASSAIPLKSVCSTASQTHQASGEFGPPTTPEKCPGAGRNGKLSLRGGRQDDEGQDGQKEGVPQTGKQAKKQAMRRWRRRQRERTVTYNEANNPSNWRSIKRKAPQPYEFQPVQMFIYGIQQQDEAAERRIPFLVGDQMHPGYGRTIDCIGSLHGVPQGTVLPNPFPRLTEIASKNTAAGDFSGVQSWAPEWQKQDWTYIAPSPMMPPGGLNPSAIPFFPGTPPLNRGENLPPMGPPPPAPWNAAPADNLSAAERRRLQKGPAATPLPAFRELHPLDPDATPRPLFEALYPPNGYAMHPPNDYGMPLPNGYGMPPQNGYAMPPPNGYARPPPNSYAGSPLGGYAGPPPGGYAGPPSNGYAGPPPNGYGMPPPHMMHPPMYPPNFPHAPSPMHPANWGNAPSPMHPAHFTQLPPPMHPGYFGPPPGYPPFMGRPLSPVPDFPYGPPGDGEVTPRASQLTLHTSQLTLDSSPPMPHAALSPVTVVHSPAVATTSAASPDVIRTTPVRYREIPDGLDFYPTSPLMAEHSPVHLEEGTTVPSVVDI